MSRNRMSQLFRFFPSLIVLVALFGCSSGGSDAPAPVPLTVSSSGIEGGVTLKNTSTGEEWTITENGELSIGAFAPDSEVEVTVEPVSALQTCRLNGQSGSAKIKVSGPLTIECDNKILFASQSGSVLKPLDIDAQLWLLDEKGETQVLAEGRFIRLFSKIALQHYFQLDNALWKTDGTEAGTVQVTLNDQVFSTTMRDFTGENSSLFFIAKDSAEKEYLYEINNEGATNQIAMPESTPANSLSIAKLEAGLLFYNSDEKRFFRVDEEGLINTVLMLEVADAVIKSVVYNNQLLILTMSESGFRKLQAISVTDFQVSTIPLPTAPETPIVAKKYADDTLLFTAAQPLPDNKSCKIIYRFNSGAFEAVVDYCNQRTGYALNNIIYQPGRLLLIETSDVAGELYELTELNLATGSLSNVLRSTHIESGISEIIHTENFLFLLSRRTIEQDCPNFILCSYELRYYAWQYKTGEAIELVDSSIESGHQWFSWGILGNWDFDKASIFDIAFFPYKHQDFGFEPWMTDGTIEGTRIVKDIKPGAEDGLFPDMDKIIEDLMSD